MRGVIEINLNRLNENFDYFARETGESVKLAAVVKANAYGHGINEIVTELKDKADYFVTATVEEAEKVGQIAPKPVLCLAPLDRDVIKKCINGGIEMSVSSAEEIWDIICISENMRRCAYVHICLDTGMNRMGIKTEKEVYKSIKAVKSCRTVTINGVYSHFFDAKRTAARLSQLNKFKKMTEKNFANAIKHISATDGCLFQDCLFDMVRVGIGLYGYGNVFLKPCLSLKGYVSRIEKATRGETVGYGGEFKVESDCFVATVSVGYGDGIPRCFNGGEVLIKGKRRKVVGRVCMDYCFVLADDQVKKGDEVVFIGEQLGDKLTAEDMAKSCGTVSYEILTGLKRLKKIYLK